MSIERTIGQRDPRGRRNSVRPDLEIQAVAERIGVTAGYLSAILASKKTPSLPVMEKLAKELGLSGIDELRGELEKYKQSRMSVRKRRKTRVKVTRAA